MSLPAKRQHVPNKPYTPEPQVPSQAPPKTAAPAEEDEVVETPAPALKKMDWNQNNRKEMLMAQIVSAGPKAFLTNRANLPPKGSQAALKYDRKSVWVNPKDGIITMLKSTTEFQGALWPSDEEGVFKFVERELKAHRHLFTQGMEQQEPAAAGTTGTKDETFTSYHQAIVDVHELVVEAKRITEEHKAGRRADAEEHAQQGKEMQDEAVRKSYPDLADDAPGSGAPGSGAPESAGGGKKRRGRVPAATKGAKSAITVAAYAEEQRLDMRELLAECSAGKPPTGYTFVDPEDEDDVDEGKVMLFDEPYLVPVALSTNPASLRNNIGAFLTDRASNKRGALALDKAKEVNRAAERTKELGIMELKAKTEAAAQQEAAKAQAAQMQMQMMMMQQIMAANKGSDGAK